MFIAVRTGLEPATPCVTGRYSNQLNYHTFLLYQGLLSLPLKCDANIGLNFLSCKRIVYIFSGFEGRRVSDKK